MKVRIIQNQETLVQLDKVMKEDGHNLFFPTHVVENDKGIVGFLSVDNTPVFYMALHSQLASARDSVSAFRQGERLMQIKNKSGLILCTEDSPYLPLLKRVDYLNLGKTTMNLKNYV